MKFNRETSNQLFNKTLDCLYKRKMDNDCYFAKNGECTAIVCYSNRQCTGRDEKGNPQYADDWQKQIASYSMDNMPKESEGEP